MHYIVASGCHIASLPTVLNGAAVNLGSRVFVPNRSVVEIQCDSGFVANTNGVDNWFLMICNDDGQFASSPCKCIRKLSHLHRL